MGWECRFREEGGGAVGRGGSEGEGGGGKRGGKMECFYGRWTMRKLYTILDFQ